MKLLAVALACLTSTAAAAQATRTWVSGVGDDQNSCSRTAPCKTFAAAILKTADKGEIDCLDPGGFGPVTITKSITIDCSESLGSILAGSGDAITVNDSGTGSPNTVVVHLRGLQLQGSGTGADGVHISAARSVSIERSQISGFNGDGSASDGIEVALTTATAFTLTVSDSTIEDNANGLRAASTAPAANLAVALDRVRVLRNGTNGVQLGTASRAILTHSAFTNNGGAGVAASAGTVSVLVDDCTVSLNLGDGLRLVAGSTQLARSAVVGNLAGVSFAGGTLVTFGNNVIVGNTTDATGGAIPGASTLR